MVHCERFRPLLIRRCQSGCPRKCNRIEVGQWKRSCPFACCGTSYSRLVLEDRNLSTAGLSSRRTLTRNIGKSSSAISQVVLFADTVISLRLWHIRCPIQFLCESFVGDPHGREMGQVESASAMVTRTVPFVEHDGTKKAGLPYQYCSLSHPTPPDVYLKHSYMSCSRKITRILVKLVRRKVKR
ncbi:hypothetical protein BV25DRAFT_1042392 [Artomyces pyxidatus]|uniref:Uncharacterized protein n=1 Tax=Artomyces pyxidatus TaxID=48021 RepID=A0ACB8ST57_9AGAM|nr:hypothetical protein BV25DRAFT_1042392 [Artomyces pyxidatus]